MKRTKSGHCKRLLAVLLALVIPTTVMCSAFAATDPVVFIEERGFGSLAEAVACASAGDTVTLEYDSLLTEDVVINKALTIEADSSTLAGTLTISAGGVVINDLNLTGDNTAAAITLSPAVTTGITLDGCTVNGYRYGVYAAGGQTGSCSLSVKKTAFSAISVTPVLLANAAFAEFKGCTFTGNEASPSGAAIDMNAVGINCADVLISNCRFLNFGIASDEATAAICAKSRGGEADAAFSAYDEASIAGITLEKCTFTGTGADVAVGTGYLPSTYVPVTDRGTNTGLDTITDLAHPVLPSVRVTLVPGSEIATTEVFRDFAALDIPYDPEFTVGAIYTLENCGKGYDNWYTDFVLTLNQEVSAKLFGNYGTWGWLGTEQSVALPQGDTRILQQGSFSGMRLTEIRDDVGTFYCLFACDRETITGNLLTSLSLKCYNPLDATDTITAQPTAASDPVLLSVSSTLPSVNTQLVTGADMETTPVFDEISSVFDYDPMYAIGGKLTYVSAGNNFDNWGTELQLKTDKPLRAKLIGRYTGNYNGVETLYDWQGTEDYVTIPAGTLSVIEELVGTIPVSQLDNIGTFYCALLVDQTSLCGETNISLEPVIRDPVTSTRIFAVPTVTPSDVIHATLTAEMPDIADVKLTGAPIAQHAVLSLLPDAADNSYVIGGTLTLNDLGIDYSDWSVGAEVTFAGDESVDGRFFSKTPSGAWLSRTGTKYKTYTSASTIKVKFPTASGTLSSLGEGYTYTYAFVADRASLLQPMEVTVQTYLYSDDGLHRVALGEPLCVNMRDELPTCSYRAVKASEFADTPVFSEIANAAVGDDTAVGASFTITDPGMGYDNYYADFVLKVTGGDLKAHLKGNYGSYGWIDLGELEFEEGVEYTIVNMPAYTTVSYLNAHVGTFCCALEASQGSLLSNVQVTLSLKLYEPLGTADPHVITIGTPLVKDVLRRAVDIRPEDATTRMVLSGDTPETLVPVLKESIGNEAIGATILVTSPEGTPLAAEERVATGDVIRITKNALTTEYAVVIYGDVNCDGYTDTSDVDTVLDAAAGNLTIGTAAASAADINTDGIVDVFDAAVYEMHDNAHMSDDEFIAAVNP